MPKKKIETETLEASKSKPRKKKGPAPKYIEGKVSEPEYSISHSEKIQPLMEQGWFDYQMCAEFNINPKTMQRWKEMHPEFAEAHEIGKCKRFHWWMTEGKKRFAEGSDKGYKYWVTIMNNMFTDMGWTSDYARNTGTQININNMQVVQKDKHELLESIKTNFNTLFDHQKIELLESAPQLKELIHEPRATKED